MEQQSERDVSFSQGSQVGFQSSFISREIGQMNSDDQNLSEYGVEYFRQYFIHGNPGSHKQFPYYLYLKQKYNLLSLQRQFSICYRYFNRERHHPQNQKIPIQSAHIKQLNKGINLFTKLPLNPLLFVRIKSHNQNSLLILVSNSFGEIMHYQIFSKKQRKNVAIQKIKRRLKKKGHPFMIIIDQVQNDTHKLDLRYFQKLSKSIKFHYLKLIKSSEVKNALNQQLFDKPESHFRVVQWIRKITLQINDQFLWVYSCTYEQKTTIDNLKQERKQFYDISNQVAAQQEQFIKKQTICEELGVRLYTLDALLFNHYKNTQTNKQSLIKKLQKIQSRIIFVKMADINIRKDHYPQRLMNCRRCKHCQIMGVPTNKKSKYKCMACSLKYQVDLPLCLDCFGDFHENILPHCIHVQPREMKKQYQKYISREGNQERPGRSSEKMSENTAKNVIKAIKTFKQIHGLMKEIEQDQPECIQIVKMFNQKVFLSIVNSYNLLFQKINQSQQIDHKEQMEKENSQ